MLFSKLRGLMKRERRFAQLGHRARFGKAARRKLCIELLEDRCLLSTVHWTCASGNWATVSCWSDGSVSRLPGATDDAVIDMPGITVTHDSGTDTVRSLTSPSAVIVSGGSLSLGSAVSQMNAPLTVNTTGTLTLSGTTLSGSGTLTNAATVNLTNGQINLAVVNQGLLDGQGSSGIGGSLSTGTAATLRVERPGSTLTVANGFTNQGRISLTNSPTLANVTLTVTNGTLVNAPGATISLEGTQGSRNLFCELDNRGTIVADNSPALQVFINKAGASHRNSGTIDTARDAIEVHGSTFTWAGGAMVGQGQVLFRGGIVVNLAADLFPATAQVDAQTATINGPGTLTNGAGKNLILGGSTINANLVNQGLVRILGLAYPALNTDVNGSLTTAAGSTIQVEGYYGGTVTSLTVASGFSNLGHMVLTNGGVNSSATLAVSSGTLMNAVGGSIDALSGQGFGTRTLSAEIDNRGAMSVGLALTIDKPSAHHQNSGTIQLSSGDLTLVQSGADPSFTNSGQIEIGTGRTFSVNGGTFTNAGTITGAGTLVQTGTILNFPGDFTLAGGTLALSSATVNSPGTLTNASTLILNGNDQINAGLVNQALLAVHLENAVNGAFSNSGNVILGGDGALTLSGDYNQADGTTELDGGTLTAGGTNATGTVNIMGGTLSGSGTINANVVSAGLVTPGTATDAGVLTVNGDYSQTGVLTMKIGGTNPGTDYDQLVISGAATFAGSTLSVTLTNGFRPDPSGPDIFQVISFGAHDPADDFAVYAGLDLGNGLLLVPQFDDTGLTLVTTQT